MTTGKVKYYMILFHPKYFTKVDRGSRKYRMFVYKLSAFNMLEARAKAARIGRTKGWTPWLVRSYNAAIYNGWPHTPSKAVWESVNRMRKFMEGQPLTNYNNRHNKDT